MKKTCVVLNGEVIHIGEWDYTAFNDAVSTESEVSNPLPEGAVIEERDFEYDADRGWHEAGIPAPRTQNELLQSRIDELTLALGDFILAGGN